MVDSHFLTEDEEQEIDIKVFVGHLPRHWKLPAIRELMSEFGEVKEVVLMRNSHASVSKGCGFVRFAKLSSALNAIKTLHRKFTIDPSHGTVIVRFADNELERFGLPEVLQPDLESVRLFVGSLPQHYVEDDIHDLFSPYGTVQEVFLLKNTRIPAAFVIMADNAGAQRAITMLDRFEIPESKRHVRVRPAATTGVEKRKFLEIQNHFLSGPDLISAEDEAFLYGGVLPSNSNDAFVSPPLLQPSSMASISPSQHALVAGSSLHEESPISGVLGNNVSENPSLPVYDEYSIEVKNDILRSGEDISSNTFLSSAQQPQQHKLNVNAIPFVIQMNNLEYEVKANSSKRGDINEDNIPESPHDEIVNTWHEEDIDFENELPPNDEVESSPVFYGFPVVTQPMTTNEANNNIIDKTLSDAEKDQNQKGVVISSSVEEKKEITNSTLSMSNDQHNNNNNTINSNKSGGLNPHAFEFKPQSFNPNVKPFSPSGACLLSMDAPSFHPSSDMMATTTTTSMQYHQSPPPHLLNGPVFTKQEVANLLRVVSKVTPLINNVSSIIQKLLDDNPVPPEFPPPASPSVVDLSDGSSMINNNNSNLSIGGVMTNSNNNNNINMMASSSAAATISGVTQNLNGNSSVFNPSMLLLAPPVPPPPPPRKSFVGGDEGVISELKAQVAKLTFENEELTRELANIRLAMRNKVENLEKENKKLRDDMTILIESNSMSLNNSKLAATTNLPKRSSHSSIPGTGSPILSQQQQQQQHGIVNNSSMMNSTKSHQQQMLPLMGHHPMMNTIHSQQQQQPIQHQHITASNHQSSHFGMSSHPSQQHQQQQQPYYYNNNINNSGMNNNPNNNHQNMNNASSLSHFQPIISPTPQTNFIHHQQVLQKHQQQPIQQQQTHRPPHHLPQQQQIPMSFSDVYGNNISGNSTVSTTAPYMQQQLPHHQQTSHSLYSNMTPVINNSNLISMNFNSNNSNLSVGNSSHIRGVAHPSSVANNMSLPNNPSTTTLNSGNSNTNNNNINNNTSNNNNNSMMKSTYAPPPISLPQTATNNQKLPIAAPGSAMLMNPNSSNSIGNNHGLLMSNSVNTPIQSAPPMMGGNLFSTSPNTAMMMMHGNTTTHSASSIATVQQQQQQQPLSAVSMGGIGQIGPPQYID